MSDWSDEETDDSHYADRRNFYKVEKWGRDDELRVGSGRGRLRQDGGFQIDLDQFRRATAVRLLQTTISPGRD